MCGGSPGDLPDEACINVEPVLDLLVKLDYHGQRQVGVVGGLVLVEA